MIAHADRHAAELLFCILKGQLSETTNMGIDLQLLTSNFRERRGEILATATLRFDRDQRLLGQLTKEASPCLVHLLPDGLKVGHYEDQGLIFATTDRYGQPLTYTTSADVRRLEVPEDIEPWNRAILAFLTALPPDTRIVLFWC